MQLPSIFIFSKKSSLFFFLLLRFYTSSAQPDLQAKPFMWADKNIGKSQINNFNRNKLPVISKKVGSAQKNYFFLGNFFGMIDYFTDTYKDEFQYLHVYIGVCYGINPIPAGYNKKLILIFAPSSSLDINNNLGFYILPSKFEAGNPLKFKIDIQQEKEWTENYIKAMPLGTINPKNPDNQFNDNHTHVKSLSETRCITYCKQDLDDLKWVKDYYKPKYPISENAAGFLGAYSSKGIPAGSLKGRFKKRITTQFEFLDNANKIFYLDDIPGFLKLPDGVSECLNDIDNGQLCPTFCE
ncbi:MAG: hypothetical protein JWO92_705 [Chitinophagaceae bacterium]|nr:hypothetical protein [Chitinophagaceae bacterium]